MSACEKSVGLLMHDRIACYEEALNNTVYTGIMTK